MYPSQEVAEEVLIESWSRYNYGQGQGPIAVYQCDDCGRFHLTLKGLMNEKLAAAIKDGTIKLRKEANKWGDRLKRR